MLVELLFTFFFSFASLFLLREVAKSIGLVDKPNLRKNHSGNIPLVGGLAVFTTIAQYIYIHPDSIPHSQLYLVSIIILAVIGALDDRYDISFKIRLFVQACLTWVMMYFSGLELNNIGNIFGTGSIKLGIFTPLVTVLAVIGAINAFNMVDGIDGLLGGLSIVSFISMALILNMNGNTDLAYLCILIVIALLPYVLMNLGFLGHKRRIFMGDAGSMMIGFTVIWLLLSASQLNNQILMRPVTCLWIIALPIMDMAAIMYRRIKRGRSPFRPDRDHLHHIFQRAGLSPIQTLFVICGLASVFSAFGIIGEILLIPESIMFLVFLVCFLVYSLLLLRNWPRHVSEFIDREQVTQILSVSNLPKNNLHTPSGDVLHSNDNIQHPTDKKNQC